MTRLVLQREKRGRAIEQIHRGRHVASFERTKAGLAQAPACVLGELCRMPVGLPELRAQAVSLLEVVAGELGESWGAFLPSFETVDEALVQLRP